MIWASPKRRTNVSKIHKAPAPRGGAGQKRKTPKTNLLLLPEGKQANTRDLDDLESDTRNITLGLARATETRDENLVVLVNEVKATIVLIRYEFPSRSLNYGGTYGHESGDLLSVLDQLDTDTLADSRVGLLGLNTDFFKDNALGVRRASSGGGLVDVAESTLLVLLIGLEDANDDISDLQDQPKRHRGRTHRFSLRSVLSLRAACNPRGLLAKN